MKNVFRFAFFSLFFTLIMCLVLLPAAYAEISDTWDNLNWTLSDEGKLTIYGEGRMKGFENNSTKAWRAYLSEIKSLEIMPGVTSVGSRAFSKCTELEHVIIPESVTAFGSYAFLQCPN